MGLEEEELREWVRRVASGEASRRQFIRTMLGLGFSGPLIAEMLATHRSAMAQGTRVAQQTFTPTRRGVEGSCACCIGRPPRSSTPTSPPAGRTSRLRGSSPNR